MVKGLFKNYLVQRLSAEPKRREYNLKSLKAVNRNQKRRKMNNENKVSGVDVIGYQITNYQQKRAIIRLRGGVELQASFVEFPKAEKRRAISCFKATRQVSHQSILAPIFLCYNKKKKKGCYYSTRMLLCWLIGKEEMRAGGSKIHLNRYGSQNICTTKGLFIQA
ncbi:PREDICTED: uncharacterized protein LOC101313308 [Fragaria vesca subsp. vesca]